MGQAVKTTQSLFLLGLNPTYVINNAIDNTMTMSFMGVMRAGNVKDMESYWSDRVGYRPPFLRRAMGPAGQGELINDPTRITEGQLEYAATRDAMSADDAIDRANRKVGNALSKFGIMSKAA